MKRLIVSDSSSNVYELSGFDYKYVPMKIVTELEEFADVDGLDTARMIDILENKARTSSTSCPNSEEWLQAFCARKYNSDFAREMSRSVRLYLKDFDQE